ncbi:unnamed protein product [Thlaspi arvense]|uniref:Pentatricopeptide repeat-containing protein n=1 Tax=Thlaspi arvense TaxID=13288 RepID=A0AAU9RBN0_THLAR|nr:unnamed protein product [Thlaspi arvense]
MRSVRGLIRRAPSSSRRLYAHDPTAISHSEQVEKEGDEGRGFTVGDLLETITEAEEELLRRLSGSLVKAFATLRMFDEAIDTYYSLPCTPDVKALNFLMSRMIASGENEMAVSVFRQFRLDLDEDTHALLVLAYRKVVRGLCNEMKVDAAERLVLEMEKHGIGHDVCVYSAIIQGHRKGMNFHQALRFFSEKVAPKRGQTNCVIASSILQCFVEMEMFSEAYHLFIEFREKEVSLDEVCYNVAFDALVKLGKVEEAIKLFREMTTREGIAPDVVNYTTLIGGCCLHGKIEEAHDLMAEMEGRCKTPDTVIYNVLAGGLARNRRVQEALGTLKAMEARGVKPTSVTHNVVIEGLFAAGETEEAEDFYKRLGHEENELSMIKGYCEAGLVDEAFERFTRAGFPLTKNVYFTLFSSLCAADKDGVGKAEYLLYRMPELVGVEPGKCMFGKLINAWCRVGEVRNASKCFKALESSKGIIPDLYTYTSMIDAHCREGELDEAYALFQDMKQRRIVPDVVTYTVLLHGNPEWDMKREMNALGVKRDLHYYTVMMDEQCKNGELEDAERIFGEMIESGIEPDAAPYTSLIARCCRDGSFGVADILVQEMLAKGIEPSQDIINLLENTRSKARGLRRPK